MPAKRKQGRPAIGKKRDPLVTMHISFLLSQATWLRRQPGGAAATLRKMVSRKMGRKR